MQNAANQPWAPADPAAPGLRQGRSTDPGSDRPLQGYSLTGINLRHHSLIVVLVFGIVALLGRWKMDS